MSLDINEFSGFHDGMGTRLAVVGEPEKRAGRELWFGSLGGFGDLVRFRDPVYCLRIAFLKGLVSSGVDFYSLIPLDQN